MLPNKASFCPCFSCRDKLGPVGVKRRHGWEIPVWLDCTYIEHNYDHRFYDFNHLLPIMFEMLWKRTFTNYEHIFGSGKLKHIFLCDMCLCEHVCSCTCSTNTLYRQHTCAHKHMCITQENMFKLSTAKNMFIVSEGSLSQHVKHDIV